ncbi:MAG: helix-turn-helix domain-containing protein [Pseudomonadota bacterium]
METMKPHDTITYEERVLSQSEASESTEKEQIDRMQNFGGVLRRYAARPDLVISVFDLEISAGAISEVQSGPCLVAVVMLDGNGESRFARIKGETDVLMPYESGMTYVFFSPDPVHGVYRTAVDGRMRGAEVRVGLDCLDRIGGLDLFQSVLQTPHSLTISASRTSWIGGFPTSAPLREAALHLLDVSVDGSDDLLVEARGLDILNTVMVAVSEPLFCQGTKSIRNAQRLEEAKAVMLSDLSRPWKVRDVAREVGLSEKRLKVDFRAKFGEPVYGFLQRSRLEHAKHMLETGADSVTEVSMAIGYANPSHFAKLFRRQYGVKPSDLLVDPAAQSGIALGPSPMQGTGR